jgi:hypothetical protein
VTRRCDQAGHTNGNGMRTTLERMIKAVAESPEQAE